MRNWYLSSWWDCWVFVQKKIRRSKWNKREGKKSCGPFQIIKNVDALIYDINHSLGIDDIIWQTSKNAVSISRFQIDEKIIVKGKLSNLGFSYQIEQIVGSVSLARPATWPWQIQQNSFFLTMCVPVQVLQSSAKLIYSDNITKNSFSIWALKCLSWQTNSFSKCPIKNGLKSTPEDSVPHQKNICKCGSRILVL